MRKVLQLIFIGIGYFFILLITVTLVYIFIEYGSRIKPLKIDKDFWRDIIVFNFAHFPLVVVLSVFAFSLGIGRIKRFFEYIAVFLTFGLIFFFGYAMSVSLQSKIPNPVFDNSTVVLDGNIRYIDGTYYVKSGLDDEEKTYLTAGSGGVTYTGVLPSDDVPVKPIPAKIAAYTSHIRSFFDWTSRYYKKSVILFILFILSVVVSFIFLASFFLRLKGKLVGYFLFLGWGFLFFYLFSLLSEISQFFQSDIIDIVSPFVILGIPVFIIAGIRVFRKKETLDYT